MHHSHTSSWDKTWERCAQYIEAALGYAHDSHSLADVRQSVDEGTAQFFPFEKSAIVTEIVDYPNRSVCRIWLAGGDMDELLEGEKIVSDWAKSLGCHGMEIIGRKGWQKVLKEYEPTSIVLVKEL
jgi:hypothetical protein